jgi:hypothetical protein
MIQTCSKSSAILSLFLVLNFRWRATATRVNGLETVKKLNLHWTGLGEVFWTSDLEVWKSARWAANKVLALTYHFSSISISLLPALRLRSVSAGKEARNVGTLLLPFVPSSSPPTPYTTYASHVYLVQVLHWFPHFPCLGTLGEGRTNQVSSWLNLPPLLSHSFLKDPYPWDRSCLVDFPALPDLGIASGFGHLVFFMCVVRRQAPFSFLWWFGIWPLIRQ